MVRKVIIFVLAIGAVTGGYFMGRGIMERGWRAQPSPSSRAPSLALRSLVTTSSASAFPSKARPGARARRTSPSSSSPTSSARSAAASCRRWTRSGEGLPGKVRIFFQHNPLPFHTDAPLAAEAAMAAEEQGKFWEMHDKLFANQQNLDAPDLEKYAAGARAST